MDKPINRNYLLPLNKSYHQSPNQTMPISLITRVNKHMELNQIMETLEEATGMETWV
jgi:hypothetical protein